MHFESAESRSLSSSDLTHSTLSALAVNPALERADTAAPFHLALSFTPNEQGTTDAYSAGVEGVYYPGLSRFSITLGANRKAVASVFGITEVTAGLSRSFPIGGSRTASLAIRWRYNTITYTTVLIQYAPVSTSFLDIGGAIDLFEEWSIGASAVNLLGNGYTISDGSGETMAKTYLLGLSYHPADAPISLHASFVDRASQPGTMHFGVELTPVDFLALRMGTSTDNGTITAGAGISYDAYLVTIGLRFDHTFGMITSFDLSGRW